MAMTRRELFKWASGIGVLATTGVRLPARAADKAKVVIIGGGFGGATCAKYLHRLDPTIQVTLVERDTSYITCPFSNLVLGGLRRMADITHSYGALRFRYGIEVLQDSATAVDPIARKVTLAGGKVLSYDHLVLAPGIDIRWDAVPGYDQKASEILPHAWKAGPQTELLGSQLRAMPDGGTVIIAAPAEPFRCPPGPYERASLIAHYLKNHKPKSKILILDAKEKFSKQELFMQAWQQLYPGMIEWVSGSSGGIVEAVDAQNRTLTASAGFVKHKGDVINFIPPQKAAEIAQQAGLTDASGWCPVDQLSFESSKHKGIYLIGDASIAGKMPKSGFSTNSQAKVCAMAIVSALHELPMEQPSYVNTCYSLVGPDYGISISAVYRLKEGQIVGVEGAGGVSPLDAPADFRRREALYTQGWYASIIADTFG